MIQAITLTRNLNNIKGLNKSISESVRKLFDWTIVFNGIVPDEESKDICNGFIVNSENQSFSLANNSASRISNSKYILLMNDDLEFVNGIDPVTPMLNILESDPSVGIVGSKLVFPKSQDGFYRIQHAGVVFEKQVWETNSFFKMIPEMNEYKGKITSMPNHIHFSAICCEQTKKHLGHPREFQAVTAAFMMIRRDLYEKAKGLDELYWYCFEDIDFCNKVHIDLGYKIVYEPNSMLIHHESSSTKNFDKQLLRCRAAKIWIPRWSKKVERDHMTFVRNPDYKIYERKF